MLETMLTDVRYALRSFRRSPGFTAVAVLTLALGLGANVAVFSVVDAVVLHPVPFNEADRLVALYGTSPVENSTAISYPNFLDWQREAKSFEELAIWRLEFFVLNNQGYVEQLAGQMVSADYFPALRVRPILGRTFTPDDDRLGSTPVALLGEAAWRGRFGGDMAIVGRSLTLNGRVYTVVGVVPDRVRVLQTNPIPFNDVFVPIGQYDDALFRSRGAGNGTVGLGRLRPDTTLQQASAEMNAIARNLLRAYPATNRDVGVRVVGLEEDIAGNLRPFVFALFGAVAFVLLIACANVANLLLARSMTRSGEFALRASLGATRGRLITQVLIEGMLLTSMGGLIGLIVATAIVRAAVRTLPLALPAIIQLDVNVGIIVGSAAVSLGAALLVGFAPALMVGTRNIQERLSERGAAPKTLRHRAQRLFVSVQVGLTLILLVGASLMVQSLVRLLSVDPGFSAEHVLTFLTTLSADRASSPDRIRSAYQDINDRLTAIPGVESASVEIGALPLTGNTTLGFWRDGEPRPTTAADRRVALFYAVGSDYFRAMGIPVLRGRTFTRQDDPNHLQVVIVDQEFARSVFPNQEAIGKRIRFTGFDRTAEIVGIVGHVKHAGLDLDATATVRSQFYMPYMQIPDIVAPLTASGITGVVKSGVATGSLLSSIREAIAAVDRGAVVHDERTMTELIDRSVVNRRLTLMLIGVFAVLALILSAVGIYAVVSYLVSQRTREIGVRTALGAQPRDVLRLVLGEGQKMALRGVAVGLGGALLVNRLFATLLYRISATDPVTLASIATLLVIVTLAACYLPARRALRIDPAMALRAE